MHRIWRLSVDAQQHLFILSPQFYSSLSTLHALHSWVFITGHNVLFCWMSKHWCQRKWCLKTDGLVDCYISHYQTVRGALQCVPVLFNHGSSSTCPCVWPVALADWQDAADLLIQDGSGRFRGPLSVTETSLGPRCGGAVPQQTGRTLSHSFGLTTVQMFCFIQLCFNGFIRTYWKNPDASVFVYISGQTSWLAAHPDCTIGTNQSCLLYLAPNEILAVSALVLGKGFWTPTQINPRALLRIHISFLLE